MSKKFRCINNIKKNYRKTKKKAFANCFAKAFSVTRRKSCANYFSFFVTDRYPITQLIFL